AVAGDIARQDGVTADRRMGADEEIGQNPFPPAARSPIEPKGPRRREGSRPWKAFTAELLRRKGLVDAVRARIADREFGKDDLVDDEAAALAGLTQMLARPVPPIGIADRDVDQDIRVDQRGHVSGPASAPSPRQPPS